MDNVEYPRSSTAAQSSPDYAKLDMRRPSFFASPLTLLEHNNSDITRYSSNSDFDLKNKFSISTKDEPTTTTMKKPISHFDTGKSFSFFSFTTTCPRFVMFLSNLSVRFRMFLGSACWYVTSHFINIICDLGQQTPGLYSVMSLLKIREIKTRRAFERCQSKADGCYHRLPGTQH